MVSFVAGATGYTGRAVVATLCAAGEGRVFAHVRPDSRELERWRVQFGELGAEVDTSAWSLEAMTARLTEVSPRLVFALLGTTARRARLEGAASAAAQYEAVDYGLTKLLLDATVASGAEARFVYLSAAGVSASARGAYMAARWRAEEAVRASGLPYLIARPSFITGDDREESRPAERVGATVADGLLRVGGWLGARRFSARYRSMSGAQLAQALVRLARADLQAREVVHGEDLRRAAQER